MSGHVQLINKLLRFLTMSYVVDGVFYEQILEKKVVCR